MRNREFLISLAIKYAGDYNLISKAIINNETVEEVICDRAICIIDKEYPKCFLNLKYPPFVLFYKGDISLLKKEMIGVVGSRKPCEYAIEATKKLVVNNKDRVIVSGLAKGIDRIAHLYAEKTIGILGSGIDYIYPRTNLDLFKRIEREGLLISEYPANVLPLAHHFPFRNRLIAALASQVYIMEAHEKSGTTTTINEALELGKDIKVLPFDVFNSSGYYNNYLIQEGSQIISIEDLGNWQNALMCVKLLICKGMLWKI